MIINYMQKKHFLPSIRRKGDSIQVREVDPPFYFILVFEVNYFFEDRLEEVGVLDHIEDGVGGEKEDSLFTLAMSVVLEDVCGEDNLLFMIKNGGY